jgi:hypothetical protein
LLYILNTLENYYISDSQRKWLEPSLRGRSEKAAARNRFEIYQRGIIRHPPAAVEGARGVGARQAIAIVPGISARTDLWWVKPNSRIEVAICATCWLIDEEDGIIAGHGRVRAAHLLGLDEVPCIVLAHLTPAQRRAYVLADSR